MNRIKILYTIPNFDTAGSGKVVYDLVKNINKDLFEVEICCFHSKGNYFKEVEKLSVPIHVFSFASKLQPYGSFLWRVFKISKFFKRNNFDLIHSWNWSSDISEPLAAKMAGINWIYTKKAMSWGSPRLWKLRSKLSTKIITLNSDMLPRFFSKMESKVKLVHLGVDTNYYSFQKKTYHTPNGLRFEADDFVVVTIANLVPIKGVEFLIDAVDSLNDSKIKLLVVGDHQSEYGQAMIKKSENPNIYFVDKQLDVRPFHAVADLFVIPTKTSWEGFPVAPVEAMSSGRIVIGSNVEGVREVLKNFPNHLFEPRNSSELASKISQFKSLLTKDKTNLENNMRKEVLEFYSIEQCLDNHQQIYQDICQKK